MMSQRGLSGMFLRIQPIARIPNKPKQKRMRHCLNSPSMKLMMAPSRAPICQDPSTMMLTLPLTLGGRNSSIAVNMAVN